MFCASSKHTAPPPTPVTLRHSILWKTATNTRKRALLTILAFGYHCYMCNVASWRHDIGALSRNNADYTIVAYATMYIGRFATFKNRCNLTWGWLVTNWSLDLSLVHYNGSQCKQNFIIMFILLKLLTVKCTIRVS
jgi:hypothetical protein